VSSQGGHVTKIAQFFARYEEGANSFDPEVVSAAFTASFLGGDPHGVVCVHNDAAFRQAIPERHAFFQAIGFRSAKILSVVETPLDERYTMAKVHWHLLFEQPRGHALPFTFFITYFLFDPGSGPKVVFYISHDDEQKVMQEAGLIPAEEPHKRESQPPLVSARLQQ
jgi:hypothetical protein